MFKKWFILAISIAAVSALVGCKGKKETGAPEGFVRINGGTFTMGSPANEAGRKDHEVQHQVTVSSFYMGKYEVTQKEWTAVMGSNPSSFQGDNLPVEMVSWYDALVFCNTLSISEGLTPAYSINGKTNPNDWGTVPTSRDATWNAVTIVANSNGYRLPTEAQWEYACRAGTTTAYNTGDTINDNTGWYSANSDDKTHEVGKKLPNAWGLYDMHGNVFEWCWDWYGSYASGAQTDPTGASSGDYRVIRGGSWNYSAEDIRSAYRINTSPAAQFSNLGFRLARPYAPSGQVAASGQEAQEFPLPPEVNLFQYHDEYNRSYSGFRFWGWSKDGKVAYSYIESEGRGSYINVRIFNFIENKTLLENFTGYFGKDNEGNYLDDDDQIIDINAFYRKFEDTCRENGIEFVQAEYRQLPIVHNNKTYNVIFDINKIRIIGEYSRIDNYKIIVETQGERKIIHPTEGDGSLNVFPLGYFLSPFENWVLLVNGRQVPPGYHYNFFVGFDLDSGFTAKAQTEWIMELTSPRMSGPEVVKLQERLLYLDFSEVGEADGYYGPMTDNAIRVIKDFTEFESGGNVDQRLWNYIFDNSNEDYLRSINVVEK